MQRAARGHRAAPSPRRSLCEVHCECPRSTGAEHSSTLHVRPRRPPHCHLPMQNPPSGPPPGKEGSSPGLWHWEHWRQGKAPAQDSCSSAGSSAPTAAVTTCGRPAPNTSTPTLQTGKLRLRGAESLARRLSARIRTRGTRASWAWALRRPRTAGRCPHLTSPTLTISGSASPALGLSQTWGRQPGASSAPGISACSGAHSPTLWRADLGVDPLTHTLSWPQLSGDPERGAGAAAWGRLLWAHLAPWSGTYPAGGRRCQGREGVGEGGPPGPSPATVVPVPRPSGGFPPWRLARAGRRTFSARPALQAPIRWPE